MIVVLHIIDDIKFIGNCEKLFSINNVKNIFLKSGEIHNDFIEKNKIDIVCIHYLRSYEAKFLYNYKGNVKFIWFFWGGDGFSLGKFYRLFLLPKTLKIELKVAFKTSFKRVLKYIAKSYFPSLIDNFGSRLNIIRSLNKFHYIVPVVPGDYYLLKKAYKINVKMYHINYVSTFFNNPNIHYINSYEARNILVGNSSTSANNHVEIIDVLKKCTIETSTKFIFPLNYGDGIYGDYISEYASKELQNSCIILRDFLCIEDYSKIMKSCEFVVMNHLRQQGLGNVIMAIIDRKTLYLNTKSTIYQFLIENDFKINTIDNLQKVGFIKLSEADKDFNYQLAVNLFGEELNVKKTTNLLIKLLK